MTPRSFGTALLLHALTVGLLVQAVPSPFGADTGSVLPALAIAAERTVALPAEPATERAPDALPPAPQVLPLADPPALLSEPDLGSVPQVAVEPDAVAPPPPLTVAQPPAEPRARAASPLVTRAAPAPKTAPVAEPAPDAPAAAPPRQAPAAAAAGPGIPDTPPALVQPSWPRSVRNGFTGTVIACVRVDATGHACSVELVQGTGRASMDEALREAFLGADYRPATRAGVPAACTHTFRVHFRREKQ
ncbi:MAG: TonB family protein [Planctomycetes bacterium]|nr:TonB family protein [Planctomycetota bacterium]